MVESPPLLTFAARAFLSDHSYLITVCRSHRFALVGHMRMFVGAAKDRLEALMATPTASGSSHARALALLVTMLGTDAVGSWLLWHYAGSTQQLLLFGFDAAVIACDGLKTMLR